MASDFLSFTFYLDERTDEERKGPITAAVVEAVEERRRKRAELNRRLRDAVEAATES